MKRALPPLHSLRAFEASARHLNFTEAARELGVTQGAVSKQVQLLEHYLATPLFDRSARKLRLLPQGEMFFTGVKEALNLVEAAAGHVRANAGQESSVVISAMPSLSYWLIPRIEAFKKQQPGLNIEIVSDDNPVKALELLEADIGLVRAKSKPKGVASELLTQEEMLLVCRPQLILDADAITRIEDIGRYTLLEHTARPVRSDAWFMAKGLNKIAFYDILRFRHFFMIVQAVKEGLGVAFLPKFLIENDIQSGSLTNILDARYVTGYSYYVIHTRNKSSSPKIQAFNRWIKAQGR